MPHHSNSGSFKPDPRSDIERFWSYTVKGPGGCIDWIGSGSRYGKFAIYSATTKKQAHHLAHRWIYQCCLGPIGRQQLLHSCDRPKCVALQHLTTGTQKQNIADSMAKGRRPLVGEGHHKAKLTESQGREIRAAAAGGEIHRSIAARYGVTRPAITAIVSGRKWRSVT